MIHWRPSFNLSWTRSCCLRIGRSNGFSTFNPHLSGYDDFGIRRGEELLSYHRTVRNEIGGALSVFDTRADVQLIPAYSAFFITSGGTLAKAAWERIATEFLDSMRAAPPVDGVYFCMHGAMASEEELDPEGWLLAETRKILGENIPISEERRIAWMAQEHGVRFIPHGWNTAVGLAADLQLASAFHGTDLVEYLTGSPFIDEITGGGWKLDAEGTLAIPTNPGLGLELDRDAVKRYTRGEKLL